jgi:predicted esterase
MDSRENHIDISFKARYYTWGDLTPDSRTIWFAVHGYGQLAKFFIRKFKELDPQKHFVVAPEGLSRFYLQGSEGRVGATWMTRENRLVDIRNYITFLTNLFEKISDSQSSAKINILGFSQGAATVCRWITEENITYDRLILWAGIFPPDLQINSARRSLQDKKINLVIGDQDEYLNPARIAEMNSISKKLNVTPEIIHYSGGHNIDAETLKEIADED